MNYYKAYSTMAYNPLIMLIGRAPSLLALTPAWLSSTDATAPWRMMALAVSVRLTLL